MMENSKKKSGKKFIIIAVLIACFVALGIGYAYLAEELNFGGTGTIDSDFKVEFQTPTETSGKDLGEVSLSSSGGDSGVIDTATFTVTLTKPGDSYVVSIPVQNTGAITAHYVGMTAGDDNTEVTDPNITLSFTAPENVATDIESGSQHVFTFTFSWTDTDAEQDVPTTLEYTFSYTINYQQAD